VSPDNVFVGWEAVVVEVGVDNIIDDVIDDVMVATFHPLIGMPAAVVDEVMFRVVKNQLLD
jgi:hypothetical protein